MDTKDKAHALLHYQNLERIARMNSTTLGFLDAISGDTRPALPYAAECTITALGIAWTASVGFEASCYDGEWTIDSFAVDIAPKDKDQWVEVDFTELPRDAQGDIERACMRELESIEQGDPDSEELDSYIEDLADKGRER